MDPAKPALEDPALGAPYVLDEEVAFIDGTLRGQDAALRATMKRTNVPFRVSDVVMQGFVPLALAPHEISYDLTPPADFRRVTIASDGLNIWDLLALVCHAHGLDFTIRNGRVHIKSKEEIQRLLDRK